MESDTLNLLTLKLNKGYYSYKRNKLYIDSVLEKGDTVKTENVELPFYIISPSSKFLIGWNIVVSICILFKLLILPIQIEFTVVCLFDDYLAYYIELLEKLITIILYIDIGLNFVTALVDSKGFVNTNLKDIIVGYIKKPKFFIDILSSFPYSSLINKDLEKCLDQTYDILRIMECLIFLRLAKISSLIKLLEKFTPTKYLFIVNLIILVFSYLYFVYFIGYIFMPISNKYTKVLFSMSYQRTKENYAYMFSTPIFLGIFIVLGNDLELETSQERIVMIFINIFSIIANAYVFGVVSNVLGSQISESGVSSNKDKIKEFCNYNDFSYETQTTIDKYYNCMFLRQKDLFFGGETFNNISNILLAKVKFEMWKKNYFESDKFFINPEFSSEFFVKSLTCMQSKIFLENERIINEGEKSNDIYFVTQSSVCHVTIHGILMKILKEGDNFGEIAVFLQSGRRTASVTSQTTNDILFIPGKIALKLLQDFPDVTNIIRKNAMESFYRTISMTRSSLITKILGGNSLNSIFKKDLYHSDNSIKKIKYKSWNIESVNQINSNNEIVFNIDNS